MTKGWTGPATPPRRRNRVGMELGRAAGCPRPTGVWPRGEDRRDTDFERRRRRFDRRRDHPRAGRVCPPVSGGDAALSEGERPVEVGVQWGRVSGPVGPLRRIGGTPGKAGRSADRPRPGRPRARSVPPRRSRRDRGDSATGSTPRPRTASGDCPEGRVESSHPAGPAPKSTGGPAASSPGGSSPRDGCSRPAPRSRTAQRRSRGSARPLPGIRPRDHGDATTWQPTQHDTGRERATQEDEGRRDRLGERSGNPILQI